MRRKVYFCLSAFILLIQAGPAQAGTEQLAHAIFVRVNGKTITQDYVIQAMRYLIKREYNDVAPEDEAEMDNLQKAALRDLVRTILIHDEAAELKITLSRARRRNLVESSGLKPEEITPTIRRILEADALFDEIMSASGTPITDPSPREVKSFYNQNREDFRTNAFLIVRTIFIGEDGIRPQSVFKERAERIMMQLEAIPIDQRTEAFAKAARESSQDVFAQFGGLLTGESPERWIPKDFENRTPEGRELFPLPMVEGIRRLNHRGEIRLAVSSDGMHILYCEDVRGGRVLPWEEAARIIDFVLKQRLKNQRMRDWLNRVYDRSDVRWHDGALYEKESLTEVLLPSEM
ncbi:MAG: peptidylprolyl isomerase [Planctomycetes bacterium]|nr:peptidylprolyl isomerase [Planctomycetota bacterium]